MAAAVRVGNGGPPGGLVSGVCIASVAAVAVACALPVLVLALAEATGSRLAVPWSDSYELAGASWAALILRMFRAALRIHRLPPGDFGRAGVLHTTPPPDNSLFPTVVGKLGATLYTNRTLEGPPPGWLEVYPLRLVDGGSITVRARSESIGCRGPNDFVTLHASASSENADWIDWAPVMEEDYGQFVNTPAASWFWARAGLPWRVGIRGNDRLYVRLKRLPAPCGPHYSIPTVHVPPEKSTCASPEAGGDEDAGQRVAGDGDQAAAGAGAAAAGGAGQGNWVAAESQDTRRVFFYETVGKGSTWYRKETSWRAARSCRQVGGAEDGWARMTVYDAEAAPCVERERGKQWDTLMKAGPKATDPRPPRLPSAAIEVRYWSPQQPLRKHHRCNLTDVLRNSDLGRQTHVRYIMGARSGPVYFERLAEQWEHPSVLASRTRRKDAPGTTKHPPQGKPEAPKGPPPRTPGGRGGGESSVTTVAAAKKPQAGVPRDEKFERYRLFSRFRRMRRRGMHRS